MITVRIMGGLGNQLFQYATARRLAFQNRAELRLDLSGYEGGTDKREKRLRSFARNVSLFNFCVTGTEASATDLDQCRDRFISSKPSHRAIRFVRRIRSGFLCPKHHIRERSLAFEPVILELPDGSYIDGYWQSWKYFADVASLIQQEFQPRDVRLLEYAEAYLARIRDIHPVIVSLHVRRGDLAYATEVLRNSSIVHGTPVGLDYIHSAMARFPSGTAFLVFSDSLKDIDWCRANIRGENLFFSEGHSDIQDFLLMGNCDHNIIANSTFSWWAAWLNTRPGRRVISPRVWFSPGSRSVMHMEDLIPNDWEIL